VLTYSFGLTSPTGLGTPGVFDVTSTKVYLDTAPVRDPVTGMIVSDTSSPTAVLKTEGVDYTLVTDSSLGKQVINMTPKCHPATEHGALCGDVVLVQPGRRPTACTPRATSGNRSGQVRERIRSQLVRTNNRPPIGEVKPRG